MADEESPEWLPAGWVVQVKMRRSGRKYKCYIAPMTGHKLYSKREVFNYLKTGRCRNKGADTHSKVIVQTNNKEERLPLGWIKKIKVKDTGSRIRKDAYYIGPATRHVFRSKKEVFNYLDTGEIHKRVRKPKKRLIRDLESISQDIPLPPATKRKLLVGSKTRRCLFTGETSNESKTVKHKQILESSMRKEQKTVPLNAFNLCANGGKAVDVSASIKCPCSREIESSRTWPEGRMISAACIAQILMEKQLLVVNGVEKHWNEKPQSPSQREQDKKGLNLPRRTSKRLAELKTKQTSDIITCNPTVSLQIRQPPQSEANSSKIATPENFVHLVSKQQLHLLEGRPVADAALCAGKPLNERKNLPVSEEKLTNDDVKAESQEATEEHAKILETDKEEKEFDAKRESQKHIGNHETDKDELRIESPITLTKEYGRTETGKEVCVKEEFGTTFPFGDSWPDPCLEFAFKTLTGEISVEDDVVIQDYFEGQFNPVPAKNRNSFESADVCVDNFLKTDDALLQFDLLEQPASSPPLQKLTPKQKTETLTGDCSTDTTLATASSGEHLKLEER